MNKKLLLLVSLVCATATLNNAFSSKEMIKTSWNTVYGYGRTSCQHVWRHKVVALVAAALVSGGIIIYKSEEAKKFIKELLGLEASEPVKYVVPSKPAKKSEEDTIALELGKTPLFDECCTKVRACDCEDENACVSECEEECACCCEEDSE